MRCFPAMMALLSMLPLAVLTSCSTGGGKPRTERVVLQEQTGDLRAFLAKELAAGNRRIVVPPGRYQVKPERGCHLRFKDLKDIEIIAKDVEMVCGATVQAIGFENCTNVTLRGLAVDYNPLPFTQGRITAIAPDKSWLEFEVAAGYPENDLEQRIEIFDPATGELCRGDAGWESTIEPLGEHRYRAKKRAGYRFDERQDTEKAGDILVTNNRFPERAGGHAVVVSGCTNLTLEEVTLYASPCFGFLEHDSNGSTYLRCRIDRRDPADDPVRRGQPRMRSLNADAFHSKHAEKGPALIGCTARFQGDDCVNINGQYHYVSRDEWNGWTVEGTAFGSQPTEGAARSEQKLAGMIGKRLANSSAGNGDAATGKLISPPFKIEHRFINFLIGGGRYVRPDKTVDTGAVLRVDGKVVRSASGSNSDTLSLASWDAGDWLGQTAVIEIIDNVSGPWGHIEVDQIEFSDAAPARFQIKPAAVFENFEITPAKQLRLAVFGKPAIASGDPVEFLPYAGSRPPDAIATKIEPDPLPITEAEKAFIQKLSLNENIRNGLLSGKAKFFTLTLDREIVLPNGSAVCSGRKVGNGFVVKDCDFGHNRSRGILIKASRGEVTGNRITNGRMAAILVSPEFWWMEAASSSDVVIRGNIIKGCLQTPIQILAPGGNGRPLPAGAHRNISILKNKMERCQWPLIQVTSTDGLTIKNNQWPATPEPGLPRNNRDGSLLPPVRLSQCEHVENQP